MNKIEIYTYLCYASAVLCVFFLVLTIIFFFLFDIRSVIGYLTGSSAKKEIKELQKESALSGTLAHKAKVSKEDVSRKKEKTEIGNEIKKPKSTAETITLENQQGKIIVRKIDETTALHSEKQNIDITDTLEKSEENEDDGSKNQISFVMEREQIFIHTDEVIEGGDM